MDYEFKKIIMRFQLNGKYEYCPNGNYWQEVSGIFDKEIYLFCDCNKCNGQVYKLKPFNITKKIKQDTIKGFRKRKELEDIRNEISVDNMNAVKKFLNENF